MDSSNQFQPTDPFDSSKEISQDEFTLDYLVINELNPEDFISADLLNAVDDSNVTWDFILPGNLSEGEEDDDLNLCELPLMEAPTTSPKISNETREFNFIGFKEYVQEIPEVTLEIKQPPQHFQDKGNSDLFETPMLAMLEEFVSRQEAKRISSEAEATKISGEAGENGISGEVKEHGISDEVEENIISDEIEENRISGEVEEKRVSGEVDKNGIFGEAEENRNSGYDEATQFLDDDNNAKKIIKPGKNTVKKKVFAKKSTVDNDFSSIVNNFSGARFFKEVNLFKETNKSFRKSGSKHDKVKKKDPFTCQVCLKKFEKRRNYDNHVLTHMNNKPHKCSECARAFRQRAHLHVHILTHLRDKPFKCNLCPNSYIRANHLENHVLRTHVKDKQYQCRICSRKCFDESELKSHVNDMHNPATHRRYTCDVCFESFRHLNTMIKHLQIKHSRFDRCDRCRRSFINQEEFEDHLTHEPFQCNQCSQELSSQCLLKQHQKMHEMPNSTTQFLGDSFEEPTEESQGESQSPGSGNFTCEICFEGFIKEAHLKYHERTKHRNASWPCKLCGELFHRKYRLKHHEMTHENPRPYKCETCLRTYIHQHDLKKHLRSHQEEKPYQCDRCTLTFPTNTYLKRHLASVHRVEKSFKCGDCTSTFLYASELRRHVKVHQIEIFTCEMCAQDFKFKFLLDKHNRRIHGDSSSIFNSSEGPVETVVRAE